MSANYSLVVNSVKSAIKSDSEVQHKWVKAGSEVVAFFGSEKALDEVKAQFIADCILPALDKKHAESLAKDLPRKGSKEFNALPDSEKTKWELANQAKKDARATCNTYYNRVKSYAFEKESKATTKKGFAEKLSALVEECANLKDANFDIVACMQFLVSAEKVVKGIK